MRQNQILSIALLTALCFCLVTKGRGQGSVSKTDENEIRKILQERVEKKKSAGIVVGLVDPEGTRVIAYGKSSRASSRDLDGDTVFEIGSVTKVFTAVLLADMIERGELNLNDPIAKFLPPSVKVPSRNGKEITLRHLANHTSGLPRLPSNMAPKDRHNPYADYTVEQMYDFLSNYTLPRDPGAKYEYSNIGGGLLGHILARKAGMDYEALVVKRICEPLKMASTRIKLSPELEARLAAGHNRAGEPVKNWDIPTLAGAGALRSTANDMLKFVAANLGLIKSDLFPAMQKTHSLRTNAGILRLVIALQGMEVALGWHVYKTGNEIIWHNGETAGYHSFIGFDRNKSRGVVVLSNSANSIDDIGLHLLDSKYELPKERMAVKVDPKIYEAYVGQYELVPNVIFVIRKEGDRLKVRATEQGVNLGEGEIFPESETKFFDPVMNGQTTFVKDDEGKVTHLIVHLNGQELRANKISNELPKERTAIKVDPKIYEAYVGQYALAPNFMITITKEGDRLMAQASGQPKFEIFPESETKFFFKVVDAQITFSKDEKGQVTQLILHQNGDHEAKKIK